MPFSMWLVQIASIHTESGTDLKQNEVKYTDKNLCVGQSGPRNRDVQHNTFPETTLLPTEPRKS